MNLEATHPFAGRHAALVLTESGAWENHLCKSGESIIVAMRDLRRRGRSAEWKVHRLRKRRARRCHTGSISNVQPTVCEGAAAVLQNIPTLPILQIEWKYNNLRFL